MSPSGRATAVAAAQDILGDHQDTVIAEAWLHNTGAALHSRMRGGRSTGHFGAPGTGQAALRQAEGLETRIGPVNLADAVPAALFTATTLLPAGVKTPAWWPPGLLSLIAASSVGRRARR